MKIVSDVSESFPLTALLTLSGGLMDSYSYLCREQVFANAQTGNLVLFGIRLVEGNLPHSLRYLIPVLAFTAGIAASEVFRHYVGDKKRLHWRQITLLAEAVILTAVAFIPRGFSLPANSLISFACGAQVESFRALSGGGGVATTMCIGNLRAATQSLCEFRFTHDKAMLRGGLLYLAVIGFFVAGAVIGKFLTAALNEFAILGSVALLLAGFFIMHAGKKD